MKLGAPEVSSLELAALADKYRRMLALRASLPRAGGAAGPNEPGPLGSTERDQLRTLAADFPGALRELDTLDTEELRQRAADLDQAAAGGPVAPWMAWLHGYHLLLRASLASRRPGSGRAGTGEPARAPASEPPHPAPDRASRWVDPVFLASARRPRAGRLNALVFDRLGELFGVESRTIWDALFPVRGPIPRSYR